MVLDVPLTKKILRFVALEPKTIQEVSLHIGKSWVTTESYIQQIVALSGELAMRTFRAGTRGALKVVYRSGDITTRYDELFEDLMLQITSARKKQEFDALDIYQHVPVDKKSCSFLRFGEPSNASYKPLLLKAKNSVVFFSGNLSIVRDIQDDLPMIDLFENLLKKGITIKILTRVNFSTLRNLGKLQRLLNQYPDYLEIKHRYQPLRGCIIDNELIRLYAEEHLDDYKKGELDTDIRIAFDITDTRWVDWLMHVFWYLYRNSVDYSLRVRELKAIKNLS